MSRRPVVYLDVDGVLNAFQLWRYTPPARAYTPFEVFEDVAGWDLTVSRSMAAALVEATAGADVVWLTTWCEQAPAHVAPLLGLPDWPWLDWEPTKASALRDDQAADPRPFVWVDDDEAVPANLRWVRDGLRSDGVVPPPSLLVQPSPRYGIGRDEMADIAAFVARWSHDDPLEASA